jgi:hypothetical protein
VQHKSSSPRAHRVVGPGTHRGSGPREVHTTPIGGDADGVFLCQEEEMLIRFSCIEEEMQKYFPVYIS